MAFLGGVYLTQGHHFNRKPADSETRRKRVEADTRAQSILLGLNFFSEGGGMHVSPNLIKTASEIKEVVTLGLDGEVIHLGKKPMTRRWGMNWVNNQAIGLFEEDYKGMSVEVLGCVACHSGKAAGHFYIGLGNKNVDVGAIGKDTYTNEVIWKDAIGAESLATLEPKSSDYKYVEDTAMEFARTLKNPQLVNLTQGLVPTAIIRQWFYRMQGLPIPATFTRAAVKVPSFWGYGEKRKVGQFCDGLGDGAQPGWAIAVELVAGQKTEVVRRYITKIGVAEDQIADLLPPEYPFPIDQERAARGKTRFENTCAHCHGTYEKDVDGLPVYKAPNLIPWTVVKTDHDRLDGITPEFIQLIGKNPLNDILHQTDRPQGTGYFSPRLHAIWARFPYLHNGSVPSVAALLTPPEQRPQAWDLTDVGEVNRFDAINLGLTLPEKDSDEEADLLEKAKKGVRSVYYTGRVGQSNVGHNFYTDIPETDKLDLIEYLKTL